MTSFLQHGVRALVGPQAPTGAGAWPVSGKSRHIVNFVNFASAPVLWAQAGAMA